MKRLVAAATALSLAVILTACSSSGSGNEAKLFDPSKLVSTTPASTTSVDKVTWGLGAGEPPTLNPVQSGTDSSYIVLSNLCENLLTLKPDFSVGPGLAKSVDWAGDTKLVIDLRTDVKFWDGKPMTAEDVAYSLQQNMTSDSGSVNSSNFASVASIDITGPSQVTLTFKAPNSQFRTNLASTVGVVFEKAYAESAGKNLGTPDGGLMCTGPYKLDKWNAGKNIVTSANDLYWNGKPLVKELDYVFIPDSSTLTSALTSGEVDGAYDIPVPSASTFSNAANGSLFVGPSTATISFGPTASTGPATDPRVREALNLAIDKSQFVAAVLKGYGRTAKTFNPPLSFSGLDGASIYQKGYDGLPATTPDIEKAKKLIAEAKPGTKPLVFAIQAGDQQSLQSATIVQAAAKQIGLTMTIKQMQATDFANIFYDAKAREGTDFVGTTGYLVAPGPLTYAQYFALPGGLFNWSNYQNADVTKYLTASEQTTDPQKAAEAFVKAQAIYNDAQLQVTLGEKYSTLFLNKKLTGAVSSMAYISSPWALHLGGK